jgi:hypothetical protein
MPALATTTLIVSSEQCRVVEHGTKFLRYRREGWRMHGNMGFGFNRLNQPVVFQGGNKLIDRSRFTGQHLLTGRIIKSDDDATAESALLYFFFHSSSINRKNGNHDTGGTGFVELTALLKQNQRIFKG